MSAAGSRRGYVGSGEWLRSWLTPGAIRGGARGVNANLRIGIAGESAQGLDHDTLAELLGSTVLPQQAGYPSAESRHMV